MKLNFNFTRLVGLFALHLLLFSALFGRSGASYGEIQPSVGKTKWDGYVPFGMKLVPGGRLISGKIDSESKKENKVVGVAAFYMDIMPITNAQYREFVEFAEANPDRAKARLSVSEQDKNRDEDDGDDDIDDEIESDDIPNIKEEKYREKIYNVYYNGVLISPDKKAWRKVALGGESDLTPILDSMAEEYFTSEGFTYFPVVCVSWKAAVEFCDWRTERLNDYRKSQELPELPPFQLPTSDQYKYAASGGAAMPKYSFGGPDCRDKRGKILCNIKATRGYYGECGYFGPSPSMKYDANGYGLYGMSGNVFNWTGKISKDGLYCAMGGSWGSFPKDAEVGAEYWRGGDGDPRIGFRCVMARVGF